jgi:hypothetical protein
MALATGSCPACGRSVARTLSTHHGLTTEAYHCPLHGRRDYSGSAMTLAEWAEQPTMSVLRQMYDTVAPRVGGLDWLI